MSQALLIIDVQQVLCEGAEAAFDVDAVVDRINRLSMQARVQAVPVIVVQHEEEQGALQWNTAGWQLSPRLHVDATDLRVRKRGSDAFHQTELQALLQARNVTQLVVCGLQSDFCVDSTVRGALARGYSVVLVSDGHSTLDNGVLTAAQITAHHNITLSNLMSYGVRATPVPAAQVRFGS